MIAEIRRAQHSAYAARDVNISGNSGAAVIRGMAIVYDSPSVLLGNFCEVIERGAARSFLDKQPDVLALFGHDPNMVLGRTSAGTLSLSEDSRGVHATIYPPDTQVGRDAVESIRRGDVRGMSFRFNNTRDSFRREGGKTMRYVNSFDIVEVSLTAMPAYPATTASVNRRDLELSPEKQKRWDAIGARLAEDRPIDPEMERMKMWLWIQDNS